MVCGDNVVAPMKLDVGSVDVEHLEDFISKRPDRRVGHYFETLILYWLTHIVKVELIAHGQQIMDGKRTVGELDFLFRDRDGDTQPLGSCCEVLPALSAARRISLSRSKRT